MLRRLYDWAMGLAAGRHAPAALGAVSFAESSLFPIPPDVMLIPMVLANRKAWWRLALLCTVASVLGALVGYGIGALLFETLGRPILAFYGAEHSFERIVGWYAQWGWLGVLAGAITPLPYKVLTIFSGSVGFSIPLFIAVSIVGRALRFFLVAGLIYWIGEPIREFIEKRLGLMFALFIVLLVGGFVLLRVILPG
ncbi:MAG: DedA family protein [Alphaproteobacteria bacterium]|nr:DedA family protein [Alphaproteobacteria bacterium]